LLPERIETAEEIPQRAAVLIGRIVRVGRLCHTRDRQLKYPAEKERMIDRSRPARLVGVLVLFSMLAACGGGSSGGATSAVPNSGSPPLGGGPTNDTPVTIQGVATPSSVAVVTATNAD
jgi:hypothetical protein